MRKISPTKDGTFLGKSFGEWNKVEEMTLVPMIMRGPIMKQLKPFWVIMKIIIPIIMY